jgi:trk system potassium uptake protein
MKIIIIGAGEVGQHLSAILSDSQHDVTVIERSPDLAARLDEELDVRVICGNGSYAGTLVKAGVEKCDFFLAMTSDDRTNLISSSLAKALGKETTTITRIHDQTYNDNSILNYQSHFGIDHLLNPEALSAVELAKAIRNPGRVAVENFARGQIEVQQFRVTPKARVIGKTLADLRLDPRIRIGYVQSGDQQEVAHAGTVLNEGDVVTVFGVPQVLFDQKSNFNPDTETDTIRVVIYGGGETGIALIRLLTHPRFRVRVLEKDTAQCQILAQTFPRVTVIHGDATSLRLMEEEQIGSADYFVACTKDDEANVMTCLQASKLGAKHTLLLINRADYIDVLERLKETLGLEIVVSPRLATANEVMRYTSRAPYVEVAQLPHKAGHIIEVKVQPKSLADGKMLREIKWPKNCVVVALLHKSEAKVPGASDIMAGGDRLVVIIRQDQIPELLKVLH